MIAPHDNEPRGPMRPIDWIILGVAALVALAAFVLTCGGSR